MKKFTVSIERVESFDVEAPNADVAIDAAFKASDWPQRKTKGKINGCIISDRGTETVDHLAEERES